MSWRHDFAQCSSCRRIDRPDDVGDPVVDDRPPATPSTQSMHGRPRIHASAGDWRRTALTRAQHETIHVTGPFEWHPLVEHRHQCVIEKPVALRDTRFHQCGDSVDDPCRAPPRSRRRLSEAVSRNTAGGARRRERVACIECGRGIEVGQVAARPTRGCTGEQCLAHGRPRAATPPRVPRPATATRELSPSSPRRWDRCAPTCHRCARPAGPPRFRDRGATRRRRRRRGRRSTSVRVRRRARTRRSSHASRRAGGRCAPRRDSRSVCSWHLHHTS